MSEFKPFPLGKPLRPGHLSPAVQSPWLVRPGRLDSPQEDFNGVLSRSFEGSGFIYQNHTLVDMDGNPLRNICGSETYHRYTRQIYPDSEGEGGSFDAVSMDYGFTESPDAVRVITTGFISGGAVVSGTSPTHSSSWYTDENENRKLGATYIKSDPVTVDYLSGKVDEWLSRSLTFRFNTRSPDADEQGAVRSESDSGYYAYVTGAKISAAVDLTPSGDGRMGYSSPFRAKVKLVTRRNAPKVVDLEGSPSGSPGYAPYAQIYRSGVASVEVKSLITDKKWRDAHGIYARGADAALAPLGYQPVSVLWDILPTSWTGRTGLATFLSADGGSYRLTVSAGKIEGGEFVALDTRTVTLTPTAPGSLKYTAYIATADFVRVTRIEALGDGGYSEITLPVEDAQAAGLVSTYPTAAARVLMVMKTRNGSRWGHPGYAAGPYPDLDAKPYYLTLRRTKNLKAVSEAAAAPAPTPADPTPATAPTAPNNSPFRNQEFKPVGQGSALSTAPLGGGGFLGAGGW